MSWEWIAADGRSGGLLLGVNNDLLEVLEYKKGVHCQGFVLKIRESGFVWCVINVALFK
jgi:hypothetical protein